VRADVVRAAGGVVWRPVAATDGPGDEVELLLVHRPKYDDWSLPKGKCDPGESDEDAAAREVLEETGLRCRMGTELDESHYADGRGRPKVVRYWTMEPVDGEFAVNDEVDEVRWVPVAEARRLLTYERDQPVIDSFDRVRRDGDT
jgi:8-oxo-dGTP pyrophosphatase MutT (NUDIX family)